MLTCMAMPAFAQGTTGVIVASAADGLAAVPHTLPAAAERARAPIGNSHAPAVAQAGSVGGAASVTLEPVNVQAAAPGSDIKARRHLVPGSVHIVGGDALHARSVGNMADALRYVPGVMAVSNTGGDDGVLSIRGSNLSALGYDNSGVALFQNGLPVTTADGANHNRLLDPLAARYLIVANGANALSYGASDLGGAIDLISPTARNSDPRQLYLTGGSYGRRSGRVSTGGVAGNLDGMLTVANKHFEGYRQHSRENRFSVYGNAGWQVSDKVDVRLFGTWIDSRQQLAGSLTRAEFDRQPRLADPSYALGNHQLDVKTGRVALKGTWHMDPHSRLEFGVSWERQSLWHPIVDVFDFDTRPPQQFFSLLIDTTQRTLGGVVRYRHQAGDHHLLLGINLARTVNTGSNYQNRAGHRGARTDAIDQRAGNVTLFALDRWKLAPRWTLVYGAQGVVTNRRLRDASLAYGSVRRQRATYNSVNPRLGLLYKLGKRSELFANVSRVYEASNNFDLDNDVRQDNATLDAMQGTSWELGTRGNDIRLGPGIWRWSLSLYYARIRDEVLSVEDPAQPGNMLSTNYGKTIHAGVGALLGVDFPVGGKANQIEPLVSVTWNHFNFDHDRTYGDNQLPSAPDYVVHGQIMYRNRPSGFYAGPTFDWVGSRYADMANTYRVDGYALVGLRVGIKRDDWQVFVQGTNLADTHDVNAISVRTQAAPAARVLNPGAPRSLFVGLKVNY